MADGEPQTGAIRMVAFGVLDATPQTVEGHMNELFHDHERQLEIEALVVNECEALGWKLAHAADIRGRRTDRLVLMGATNERGGFVLRTKIGEGTLQEVCRAAVDYLDQGVTKVTPDYER